MYLFVLSQSDIMGVFEAVRVLQVSAEGTEAIRIVLYTKA